MYIPHYIPIEPRKNQKNGICFRFFSRRSSGSARQMPNITRKAGGYHRALGRRVYPSALCRLFIGIFLICPAFFHTRRQYLERDFRQGARLTEKLDCDYLQLTVLFAITVYLLRHKFCGIFITRPLPGRVLTVGLTAIDAGSDIVPSKGGWHICPAPLRAGKKIVKKWLYPIEITVPVWYIS